MQVDLFVLERCEQMFKKVPTEKQQLNPAGQQTK